MNVPLIDDVKKALDLIVNGDLKHLWNAPKKFKVRVYSPAERGDRNKTRAPRGTRDAVKMADGKVMRLFEDGSLRHAHGVLRGKAARKAFKKAKRALTQ